MPVQKAKSPLAGLESQLKTAHEAHKADDTVFDSAARLPAGIENGIARLVDCKFDIYKTGDNKGKPFFRAAGVVVSPTDHDGVPIEGLQTSIMEPICSTPGKKRETVSDHIAHVYNELRKLGVNTAELEFDDLEATVAALKESQPHFRFRTWKGKKATTGPYAGREPMVNEVWNGLVDYDESASNGDDVKDNSSEAGNEDSDSTPSDAESPDDTAEVMIRNLADAAAEDDEESMQKLSDMARDKGLDPESYDTWQECAEAILGASADSKESEGSDEGQDDEPKIPAKGDSYRYKPKGKTKAIDVEVTAVNTKAETVTIKSMVDGKTLFKDVPFDKLIEVD